MAVVRERLKGVGDGETARDRSDPFLGRQEYLTFVAASGNGGVEAPCSR